MSDLTWPTGGGDASSAAGRSPNPGLPSHVAKGVPVHAIHGATHRLRVVRSRSMRAIGGEVEALLDGVKERARRDCAVLASELIAQVVGRVPDFDGEPVGLTVPLRADAVRLEATGPVAPSARPRADHDVVPADPLADWGRFILDSLADRWGVENGAWPSIWAEIEVAA